MFDLFISNVHPKCIKTLQTTDCVKIKRKYLTIWKFPCKQIMKWKKNFAIKKFNIRKQREHFKLEDIDISCRRVSARSAKKSFQK